MSFIRFNYHPAHCLATMPNNVLRCSSICQAAAGRGSLKQITGGASVAAGCSVAQMIVGNLSLGIQRGRGPSLGDGWGPCLLLSTHGLRTPKHLRHEGPAWTQTHVDWRLGKCLWHVYTDLNQKSKYTFFSEHHTEISKYEMGFVMIRLWCLFGMNAGNQNLKVKLSFPLDISL